jgi:hypothetical protein
MIQQDLGFAAREFLRTAVWGRGAKSHFNVQNAGAFIPAADQDMRNGTEQQ